MSLWITGRRIQLIGGCGTVKLGRGEDVKACRGSCRKTLRGRNAIAECERIPAGMLVLMAASLAGCVC